MKQYKSRDKITQKMTRDGLIEVNETQQTAERISKREQDADFQKSPEQQAAQDGTQLQGVASQTSPLPHAPGASPARDTATAERVMEHIEAAQTRRASKKAVHKAQEEVTVQTTSSRLQFTEEELAVPELECYIEKSNKAADRLDAAKAAIPKQKKLVKERTFDEAAGKAKTRLHFEEQEKPIPGGKKGNPLSRPAQEAGIFVHNKIHSVEKDNSGVEGAHKSEELAERGAKYGARKLKQGYRSHKLKPYREAAKAEKAAFKANVNFQYHKTLHDNPQLTSNPLSRFMQKQQIKRQYAKAAKKGGAKAAAEATRKTAKKTAEETRKAAAFAARHPAGILIAVAALLLFIMISAGLSSCGAMFSGLTNGVLGTSYTSEDSDLVAVENNYAALENGLQSEIDNIESTHPGYDEYRYDLDSIGHNPHELASYLTALLQSYTPQSAQAELERIFSMQYTLTLTEEVEIRYRTETSTDPETGETTTEEVPYEYYILNVKLTNKLISELAEELLTPQQLEMFHVYLETSGNKPLIFGGGSPDGSPSEDLSGVEFVNGTRPGNPELMELAKQQVGNVGGYPYWSWYGFNSRVEWCACFVSWCYNQAGKSEPRFAGCEWQGVPWFQSRGQWGARGYENIAPGDAIFFDWDLDGVADHVGLVLGRDGSRVYTVEGNSGDACKIKSYDLDTIGHNPHELASYLTALLQSYTPQSAQAELKRLFGLQYTLTLTEEIEIRTTTDEEGNEEEYEYRILNVKLTNKPIASLAEELLNPQQFEMFKVYLQTQGNKPLIFGGGSPDGSPSEDLSGVEFVNGTRPGNQELMELAKQQVGNVGGYPYWSWYGFNSRVEWCACFVSWCYNQAGKSEPRFAGCEWQGVPWFQSRGQWGARGYENIAPGDAIFFDWDLDGVADHVGLVLGRDGSRVYTVEGNSGDACKIKSYDLNYQCIKGYGLMNW